MSALIGWIAAGMFLSNMLMVESISWVENFLRRLWRKKEVPEEVDLGALTIIALAMIVAGPILLVFPLARQRVREYFRYYAEKAR